VAYETERSTFLNSPGADDWQPRHYGDATAGAIDLAVRRLIDDAFVRAQSILAANKGLLLETAAELLTKETLPRMNCVPSPRVWCMLRVAREHRL